MNLNIEPLDKLAEAAKDFIQKVITPPLEEIGLLLTDKIKLWRFKNQISILSKAENMLKERGLKTRKVSLKVMTPLIEECGLEDDESLQNKWAALIANTVCVDSKLDTTLYSKILSEMTKSDAELFETLFNMQLELNPNLHSKSKFEIYQRIPFSVRKLRDSAIEFDMILDNLIRLRLIKEVYSSQGAVLSVIVTQLGINFLSVITPN